MSPEPTGVHGLLKQRKLFTHKLNYNTLGIKLEIKLYYLALFFTNARILAKINLKQILHGFYLLLETE